MPTADFYFFPHAFHVAGPISVSGMSAISKPGGLPI